MTRSAILRLGWLVSVPAFLAGSAAATSVPESLRVYGSSGSLFSSSLYCRHILLRAKYHFVEALNTFSVLPVIAFHILVVVHCRKTSHHIVLRQLRDWLDEFISLLSKLKASAPIFSNCWSLGTLLSCSHELFQSVSTSPSS